jgi:hypothetical protein
MIHDYNQHRPTPRTIRRNINAANAELLIGPVAKGINLFAICKGQCSLIEVIDYLLHATGPANVDVSAWTVGGDDILRTEQMMKDGRILGIRWLMDASMTVRQPAYCAMIVEKFGEGSIMCTANHTKFVLIRNDEWNLAIRSSMNLNRNQRLETLEISDDRELAEFMATVCDAIFTQGLTLEQAQADSHMGKQSISWIGGGIEQRPPVIECGDVGEVETGKHRGISYE